jgi:hypothetical protein
VKEQTSHRDAVKRVREAKRFALVLPGLGRVPIPTPENMAFYVALALLVVVKYIDWPLADFGIAWPVAVTIGLGHALSGRTETTSGNDTAAAIDQMRAEIRLLAETLQRNGAADLPPTGGTDP